MILGTRFAWNTIKPVCRSLNCCVNGGRVCGRGAAGSSPTPPVFTLRCRLATCYGEKKKKKKHCKNSSFFRLSAVCLCVLSQPLFFNTSTLNVFLYLRPHSCSVSVSALQDLASVAQLQLLPQLCCQNQLNNQSRLNDFLLGCSSR